MRTAKASQAASVGAKTVTAAPFCASSSAAPTKAATAAVVASFSSTMASVRVSKVLAVAREAVAVWVGVGLGWGGVGGEERGGRRG
jgi:hypothetical protein